MEVQSNQRKKPDDLPRNDDEFWNKADVNTYRVVEKKCDHEFTNSRTREGVTALCYKCKAGYLLGPGMEIKKKHIYIHGSFVI